MEYQQPYRILQVFSSMNAGGMENYIMNVYRNIDRTKIQFDFLVHHKSIGLYEEEILRLGGKIYRLPVLDNKDLIGYIKGLNAFFAQHKEYRIVHGHLSSLAVFYLGAAQRKGVPYRIAHSHGAGFLHTPKGYAKYLLFRTTKRHANIRFACSTEAGRYLYGKDPFEFMPNGISTERFAFDQTKRDQIRGELQLKDTYVIGHVGRFNLQKNHSYLLKIFQGVADRLPEARLLLLGDGELFSSVRNQAEELGIADKVVFAGVHKNVEDYYQAMDVFVLPSLFEGLPLTGVEAQYAGLPCLFSDTITREVKVTDSAEYLKIGDDGLSGWTEALLKKPINSHREKPEITTPVFDIKIAAKQLQERYLSLLEAKEEKADHE